MMTRAPKYSSFRLMRNENASVNNASVRAKGATIVTGAIASAAYQNICAKKLATVLA